MPVCESLYSEYHPMLSSCMVPKVPKWITLWFFTCIYSTWTVTFLYRFRKYSPPPNWCIIGRWASTFCLCHGVHSEWRYFYVWWAIQLLGC